MKSMFNGMTAAVLSSSLLSTSAFAGVHLSWVPDQNPGMITIHKVTNSGILAASKLHSVSAHYNHEVFTWSKTEGKKVFLDTPLSSGSGYAINGISESGNTLLWTVGLSSKLLTQTSSTNIQPSGTYFQVKGLVGEDTVFGNLGATPAKWSKSGGFSTLGYSGSLGGVSSDGSIVEIAKDAYNSDVIDQTSGNIRFTGLTGTLSGNGDYIFNYQGSQVSSQAGIQTITASLSGYRVQGKAISNYGQVVGYMWHGQDHSQPNHAFIWDEANGTRSIEDLLRNKGIDLGTWTLTSADVISPDGNVIAGSAYDYETQQKGKWVVTIDPICEPGL